MVQSFDSHPGTALITGASSGIGAAFACQLAAQHYNLVLVARRPDRLQALADDLCKQYPIQAEILPADLSQSDGIAQVEERLGELDRLTMLVNSAGFNTPGLFLDVDFDRLLDLVQLHVITMMRLTRVVLPGMVQRRHGAVINVSSGTAFYAFPATVTYNATKAFINMFTESLAYEVRKTGVKLQVVCPGFTRTEIFDTPEFAKFDPNIVPFVPWMEADEVARLSLRALKRGKVVFIPGWKNRLLVAALRWMPGVAPIARAQTLKLMDKWAEK